MELHPRSKAARLVRSLRFMQSIRGWDRLTKALVPRRYDEIFVAKYRGGYYTGGLGYFIDRAVYLRGGYEHQFLDLFEKFAASAGRQGVILDIGANVGTHSLSFSRCFSAVHSFEPNPLVWPRFKANVAINERQNITLHEFGLGDANAELPPYNIAEHEFGMGTVLPIEQYDEPLKQVGTVSVRRGDDIVEAEGIRVVSAMKIDVQGFEPEVLKGLRSTLAASKPIVWLEVGYGTGEKMDSLEALSALFPFPIEAFRFASGGSWRLRYSLEKAAPGALPYGDYLVVPQ